MRISARLAHCASTVLVLLSPPMSAPRLNQDENLGQGTSETSKVRVHLPGFLVEEPIGLGDVIKRATYAVGWRACSGCERRAEVLNRWISFHR